MVALIAGPQGFVPSQILADVHDYYARTGNLDTAASVYQTLAETRVIHARRHEEILPHSLAEESPLIDEGALVVDPRPGVMDRLTHDCLHTTILPGRRIITEGEVPEEVTRDKVAINVHHEALKLHDHLQKRFGRNSLDERGKNIVQCVNYGRDYNNAANTGQLSFYGNGDGKIFKDFGLDNDVIVHELWHEITSYNAGADKKRLNRGAGHHFDSIRYGGLLYFGQSGAANESWSDVMAKVYLWEKLSEAAGRQLTYDELPQDFWRLGATCMVGNNKDGTKSSIRHFHDQPGYDREDIGRDRQTKHMSKYYAGSADNYGVHINSGILNRAFEIACQTYRGYAPASLGLVYYFGERLLHDRVNFKEIVAALFEISERLFANDPKVKASLEAGFTGVGLWGPGAVDIDEVYELAGNNRVRIFEDVNLKENPGRYHASEEQGGGTVWTIGRPVDRKAAALARAAIRANLPALKQIPGFERAALGLKNGRLAVLVYRDSQAPGAALPPIIGGGYEVVPVVANGNEGFNLSV